jgi:hypothetical protein
MVGLALGVLGCWIGFWGPFAARNAAFGITFIAVGALVISCGIVAIALPIGGATPMTGLQTGSQPGRFWEESSAYRVGPIPFSVLALAAMVAVNGLGLKRGFTGKRLIGANLIMIACIALCYALLLHAKTRM